MTVVLAALDVSPAALPVLSTAGVIAEILGAELRAVHVADDSGGTAQAVSERAGVRLLDLHGKPVEALLDAASAPDVLAIVLGLRGHLSGRRPAGRTATGVIERLDKPAVLVPPESRVLMAADWKRVLVPLDGTEVSAAAADEALRLFSGSGLGVVVLHVFDTSTVPRFWDRSSHGTGAWSAEFLARWCAHPGVELNLRIGAPGIAIVEFASDLRPDLIVLGWSGELAIGRETTVQEVLARSIVPVMLVPITKRGAKKRVAASN